jgi:hypothetical protein
LNNVLIVGFVLWFQWIKSKTCGAIKIRHQYS